MVRTGMGNDPVGQRIALVTGANKGIGFEVAAQLAELGITVVVTARDDARRQDAAARLREKGGQVHEVALDVTDSSTVEAAARYVDERLGRLDILVNNAGIGGDVAAQRPSSADLDMVRKVFDTNYFGVIAVTNAMLPLLRRSAAPRIVNVTSGLGSLTNQADQDHYLVNVPAMAGYPPAKTALNALTVQYAKELRADGILVNAIDPGGCDTDFTRGRFTVQRTAAQGAAVAVRLATIPADGPTGGYFNESGTVAW